MSFFANLTLIENPGLFVGSDLTPRMPPNDMLGHVDIFEISSLLEENNFFFSPNSDYYVSHPAFRRQVSFNTKHLLLDSITLQQIYCSGW